MLLLLLNYVVLRTLWKIDVHLIGTLVNKSLYYYYKSLYYFKSKTEAHYMLHTSSQTHVKMS